jgi:hypothetical protein
MNGWERGRKGDGGTKENNSKLFNDYENIIGKIVNM